MKYKFKNGENENINYVLNKCDSATGLPANAAYRLGRLTEKIRVEMRKIATDVWEPVAKKYACVDENGKFVYKDNNHLKFPSPENEAEYKKWFNEFLEQETEIEVKSKQITVKDLEGVGLSPAEMRHLSFFIEGWDSDESQAEKALKLVKQQAEVPNQPA